MLPLVSVIIPTYNSADFLTECIESVLNQTYHSIEIIIIDDGSTDDTPTIGKRYSEQYSNIIYIRQENTGVSAARNNGIKRSQGKYISFLDSDDYIALNKIERAITLLQSDPNIDIVYHGLQCVNSIGHKLFTVKYESYSSQDLLAGLFYKHLVCCPTIIGKSDSITKNLFDTSMKHSEDDEMILKLAHHARFHYIDEPLVFYRLHESNLAKTWNIEDEASAEGAILRKYDKEHIKHMIDLSSFSQSEKEFLKGMCLAKMDNNIEAIEKLKKAHDTIASLDVSNKSEAFTFTVSINSPKLLYCGRIFF